MSRKRLALVALSLLTSVACPGAASPVVSTPAPTPAATEPSPVVTPDIPVRIDWTTFGFDVRRSGFNPYETELQVDAVDRLHELWSFDLGGATVTSPVVAAGVDVDGVPTDLVVTGSESGEVFALDVTDGRRVWHRRVGFVRTGCQELPDGIHGISGSPVLDRPANRVYVAGGTGKVYALDLSTGKVADGWPVTITTEPEKDHVYGALTLWNEMLYVATAGICEPVPFYGKLFAIDTGTATIKATFYPTEANGPSGGGMWGAGGVSVEPATGDVFVATGNARTHPENFGYAEHVVRLSASLAVKAADGPSVSGIDSDFGASPLLYRAPGCPPQLAALNKDGEMFVYDREHIGDGPVQRLQLADAEVEQLQGVPAYSAETHLVYVANPSDSTDGTYTHGLLALKVKGDCTLGLAWQAKLGANHAIGSPPSVAGGVVYFADGFGRKLFALDATTGDVLWDSGRTIHGSIQTAPVVVNGQLYVGALNGFLYAFGV